MRRRVLAWLPVALCLMAGQAPAQEAVKPKADKPPQSQGPTRTAPAKPPGDQAGAAPAAQTAEGRLDRQHGHVRAGRKHR